jgi:hypothetical protein
MEENKQTTNEGPISLQALLLVIGLIMMVISIVILATTGTRMDWLLFIGGGFVAVSQI